MKKTLLALVIMSISINAFAFYREKCSLVECHDLSRQEIADIKKEGVTEKFMNDEDTVVDLRKIYDEKRSGADFPAWFNNELKSRVDQFAQNLNSKLKSISGLERKFAITIPKDVRVAAHKNQTDLLNLNDSNACLVGHVQGDHKKVCNSSRRSCARQVFFALTLGGAGENRCSAANSHCTYSRDWEVVVRTEVNGRETIQPYSFRTQGEYKEEAYHVIMNDISHKAEKNFNTEDDRIIEIIKEMPKCR